MGLLDDAIREHLELKRRRGADPGEVAREQREALDETGGVAPADASAPVGAPEETTVSGAPLVDRPVEELFEPAAASELPPSVAPADPVKAATPVEPASSAGVGETAELDMSSVLGEGAEDATAADPTSEPGVTGDSLEWEMPADTAAKEAAAEESDEDVLEETPDFLRDTPEQDRLWFEQQPPRDFDFDK
ncbi:MAG: hypothetical protein ACHQHO_11670 [Solirubrobacterales bacterium]